MPEGDVGVYLDDEVLLEEEDDDPAEELDPLRIVEVLPVRDGHGTVEQRQHLDVALPGKLLRKPEWIMQKKIITTRTMGTDCPLIISLFGRYRVIFELRRSSFIF